MLQKKAGILVLNFLYLIIEIISLNPISKFEGTVISKSFLREHLHLCPG